MEALENYIRTKKRVLVAYSGGVDSSLLAYVSRKVLGRGDVLAVTGDSASVPMRDREFVIDFCLEHDIPHRFIKTYEQEDPNYQKNPENRCFFCKSELYRRLQEEAIGFKTSVILDGTNATDLKGHRPGYEALKKASITAPFLDLNFEKGMIRKIAKDYGLTVAEKPQTACLASRVPTGIPIQLEILEKIDHAENILRDLGLQNPRVRFHENLARIELKEEEWALLIEKNNVIRNEFKIIGFDYITLDLKPYSREG